jgi:hypothetical protein
MFSNLLTLTVNNFCSYRTPDETCDKQSQPSRGLLCSNGVCPSCDVKLDSKATDLSSVQVYQKLDQCQRKFRPVSKYFSSLGQNCSASVYQKPNATVTCLDKNCEICSWDGPTVVVQCSYGSSTNQTSSPNTSALTGQIVINFYYMLALGFGEVVFNALYVPPSLAHLIRLGRSAPHVVTICFAATRGFCELLAPI